MSDEMIKRAAFVIDPWAYDRAPIDDPSALGDVVPRDEEDRRARQRVAEARAVGVLAALRRPTKDMIEAGRKHCRDDQSNYGDAQAVAVYQAMIEAACRR